MIRIFSDHAANERIFLATLRYACNAHEIDNAKAFPGTGSRVDLALAFLIM
jgi:hypothetical protein